jgi:hypothetical protein
MGTKENKIKTTELPSTLKNKGKAMVESTNTMKEEIKMRSDAKSSIVEDIHETEKKVNVDKDTKKKEKGVTRNAEIKMSKAFERIMNQSKEKEKKESVMVYMDKETADKFKTLAMMTSISISKLALMACQEMIKGQEINEKMVEEYAKKHSKKGPKNKQ